MRTLFVVWLTVLVSATAVQAQEAELWWTPNGAMVSDSIVGEGYGICATDNHLDSDVVASFASSGDLWTSVIHPRPDELSNQTPRQRMAEYRALLNLTDYECTVVSRQLAVEVQDSRSGWTSVQVQGPLTFRMLQAELITQNANRE